MDITIKIKDVDPEFMRLARKGIDLANKQMNNAVQIPNSFEVKFNDLMKDNTERTVVLFSHAMAVYCAKNRIKLDQ